MKKFEKQAKDLRAELKLTIQNKVQQELIKDTDYGQGLIIPINETVLFNVGIIGVCRHVIIGVGGYHYDYANCSIDELFELADIIDA